jgi:hypothetical protein
MIQNKIFDKVLREAKRNNYNRRNLNKLFEDIFNDTNEENDTGSLRADPVIFNNYLSSIFNDVINQCANENTLNYSTLSVNKKSVPFNHLIR